MTGPDQPGRDAGQSEDRYAVERRDRNLRSYSDQELLDWLNRELLNTAWVSAKELLIGALRCERADRGLPPPGHDDSGVYVFKYRTRFEIRDGKVVRNPA